MKSFHYLEVEQPIGMFYLTCMPASYLLDVVETVSRFNSNEGIQRQLSQSRLNSIADYCSDPDAIFPTPIVISIYPNEKITLDRDKHIINFPEKDEIGSEQYFGEVIDGQHRLWGIKRSLDIDKFNLPVVLMFDLTLEEKAYVFSTINSNQTKVPPSLIFDLFDVSTLRSPQKTAHQIARSLNSDRDSPFYNRLKMLGVKQDGQDMATLSQGIFVKELLKLISRDPDQDYRCIKNNIPLEEDDRYVFRRFFLKEDDPVILKIIFNCFNALKNIFYEEWSCPTNNILWKSTGFGGVMRAMTFLVNQGIEERRLDIEYFEGCFKNFKTTLQNQGKDLTSKAFPGGGQQSQKKIADFIKDSQVNISVR